MGSSHEQWHQKTWTNWKLCKQRKFGKIVNRGNNFRNAVKQKYKQLFKLNNKLSKTIWNYSCKRQDWIYLQYHKMNSYELPPCSPNRKKYSTFLCDFGWITEIKIKIKIHGGNWGSPSDNWLWVVVIWSRVSTYMYLEMFPNALAEKIL